MGSKVKSVRKSPAHPKHRVPSSSRTFLKRKGHTRQLVPGTTKTGGPHHRGKRRKRQRSPCIAPAQVHVSVESRTGVGASGMTGHSWLHHSCRPSHEQRHASFNRPAIKRPCTTSAPMACPTSVDITTRTQANMLLQEAPFLRDRVCMACVVKLKSLIYYTVPARAYESWSLLLPFIPPHLHPHCTSLTHVLSHVVCESCCQRLEPLEWIQQPLRRIPENFKAADDHDIAFGREWDLQSKVMRCGVVRSLYNPARKQCNQCGLRLAPEQLEAHYNWHFEQNSKQRELELGTTGAMQQRSWFGAADDWAQGSAGATSANVQEEPVEPCTTPCAEEAEPTVVKRLADQEDDLHICAGCGEVLDKDFDQDQEAWLYRGDCVRYPAASRFVYHRPCLLNKLQ